MGYISARVILGCIQKYKTVFSLTATVRALKVTIDLKKRNFEDFANFDNCGNFDDFDDFGPRIFWIFKKVH